jgi:hypothetical protein
MEILILIFNPSLNQFGSIYLNKLPLYYNTLKINNMKPITLSKDSIFSVDATNLSGKKTGEQITSYHFIYESRNILETVKNTPEFQSHLYEYSAILKLLVKNELLEEMKKRIDNIDTFYN